MSKKIRTGDVWSIRHLNHDSTFIVWIDEDEQLINIDECGRSWPLIDDYWHNLVKRLQKGYGDPFIPAALRESETSQNDGYEALAASQDDEDHEFHKIMRQRRRSTKF